MNKVKRGFRIGWLKRSLAVLFIGSSLIGAIGIAHAQCVPPPSGIVAWWKGEGNTADSIGNNNGVVTNGTLGYAPAEVGQGFDFDGSPIRLLVPDSPSLNFGSNQDFTIEGWIRAFPTNTPQGVMTIIDKRSVNGASQCQGYELSLLYGQLNFRFSDNPNINGYQWSAGPNLYDGQLHHVAVTVQRNSTTGGNLYVDGVSILQFDPTLAPGDLTTTEPLRIGNHPDPSYTSFFDGQIDEFSIYRSALSSNEIASIYNAGSNGKCPPLPPTNSCYPAPSGIIGWWPGEGNALDIIGTNNGILEHGVKFTNGIVNEAFHFNGSNQDVQIPYSTTLEPSNVTVECWVKLDALASPVAAYPGLQYIVFKQNSRGGNFEAYEMEKNRIDGQDVSRFLVTSADGQQVPAQSVTVPQTGVWYHLAGTYDGATVKLYVNGVQEASVFAGFPIDYGTEPVYFGTTGQSYDGRLQGTLDEVSIYNRALSSNEVAAIYSAGSDGKCPPTNSPVTIPPFIITQPISQTVTAGSTVAFSVVAGGSAPLSYVWMSVGTNSTIVGTNATLTFTNVQPSQAGSYQVFVSNPYGTTNSAVTTLTVNSQTGIPPHILLPPRNQTVTEGGSVLFRGAAIGTQPISYQWTFDGSNIVGATSAILTLTNVQFSQAGTYQVYVSNAYGATNSAPVTLTVNPQISCYPAPSGILAWWPGESNTVDIINGNNGVVTNGTLGYAPAEVGLGFNFDGSPIRLIVPDSPSLNFGSNQDFTIEGWIRAFSPSNAPEDVMTIIDKRFVNGATQCQGYEFSIFEGQLNFRMSDDPSGNGGEWSGGPNLYDGQLHHVAVTVQRGSTTGGNLYVDGVSVVQFDPTVVPGDLTTTEPLRIGNHPDPSYAGFFDGQIDEFSLYNRALSSNEIASIFNSGGDGKCPPTNNPVGVAPFFEQQPTNQTVTAGETASFSVVAGGTAPLNYQWTFDGTNILGATNPVLTLNNVQSSEAGTYVAIVSNLYGSTNSINATLTVNSSSTCVPPPSGIVAWWRAEGNTTDSISTNNGVVTNGALGYAAAEVGLGFNFDGSPTRLIVPDSSSLNFGSNQDFTIEGWIRAFPTNTPQGVMTILDKRTINGANQCHGYELSLLYGQLSFRFSDNPNINGYEWSGGPNLYDGQLHHVAVTIQRNSTTGGNLYVDGLSVVQFDSALAPGDLTTTAPLRIGNHPDPTYTAFFDGQIDELSLYKRALSSNEIASIYSAGSAGKCPSAEVSPSITTQPMNETVTEGLTTSFTVVAIGTSPLSYQWTFGGSNIVGATRSTLTLTNVQLSQTGTYAVTVSNPYGTTNSINATLTVNPSSTCVAPPSGIVAWWRAEGNTFDSIGTNNGVVTNGTLGYAAAEVGLGFNFDGSPTRLIVPDSPSLNFGSNQDFTIEGWIRAVNPSNGPPGVMTIIDKRLISDEGCQGYEFSIFDSQLNLRISDNTNGNGSEWSGGPNLFDGQLHHVAVTVQRNSSTGGNLYVDGVSVVQFNPTLTPGDLTTTEPLRIGNHADPAYSNAFFNGQIDEFSVYRRALGSNEIVAIFDAGTDGKCPPTNNPAAVAPFIERQPTNQIVMPGNSTTFSVLAGGTAPLKYQWFFNQTNKLFGKTNSVLQIINATNSNVGNYFVIVTNVAGSATSSVATLTIRLAPLFHQMAVHSGMLTLNLSSQPSTTSVLYYTTNLAPPIIWTPICTNYTGGTWQFTDTNKCVNGAGARYYWLSAP